MSQWTCEHLTWTLRILSPVRKKTMSAVSLQNIPISEMHGGCRAHMWMLQSGGRRDGSDSLVHHLLGQRSHCGLLFFLLVLPIGLLIFYALPRLGYALVWVRFGDLSFHRLRPLLCLDVGPQASTWGCHTSKLARAAFMVRLAGAWTALEISTFSRALDRPSRHLLCWHVTR